MLHFRGFRSVGGGRQSPSQTPLAAENFGLLLYDVVFCKMSLNGDFFWAVILLRNGLEKSGGGVLAVGTRF